MGRDGGLVDVRGSFQFETAAAYAVKFDEDQFASEAEVVFLPKSKTEKNSDGTFTIPYWLAEEKGLLDHVE